MKLGMIGLSPENGHPYSFSAIINGYDEVSFSSIGWDIILHYLKKRDASEFGFTDVSITHAWTQDYQATKALCKACYIPNCVNNLEDMIGFVDGVLIARDDYQNHLLIAKPFLEASIPVFIDKPLTLDLEELEFFMKFIRSGKLMSTSGFRYAKELDIIRKNQQQLGTLKLVHATVLNDYYKYGIHMLDAVSGLFPGKVVSITKLFADYEAFSFKFKDGYSLTLSCLGHTIKTFHLALYGTDGQVHLDLFDNFSAFRRIITKFIDMIRHGTLPVDPVQVEQNIKLLILGGKLEQGQTIHVS